MVKGYKKFSKALNLPRSAAISVITSWKEYATTQTLPIRPSFQIEHAGREVPKSPAAALKELQSSLTEIEEPMWTSTV